MIGVQVVMGLADYVCSRNKIVPYWYGGFRVWVTVLQVMVTLGLYWAVCMGVSSTKSNPKNILYPLLKQTITFKDKTDLEKYEESILYDEIDHPELQNVDLDDELILPPTNTPDDIILKKMNTE